MSEEQVVILLKNQELVEPSKTLSVVETPETRKSFLKGLREYLALAARARREGIFERSEVKRVLNFKVDSLLSSLYLNRLDNQKGDYFELPKDQIETYLVDASNLGEFDADMQAIREIQRSVAKSTGNPLPTSIAAEGEGIAKTRESWAKSKILSSMARSDAEFMNDPAVQLRLKVLEAGTLATNYLNAHYAERILPSEVEVAEYLKQHPELEPKRKRELAERVLERVEASEDFAALAKEFSEDRTNKSLGGVYEGVLPNFLWPEVEKIALSMRPGDVFPQLIESKDGWHILGLISRNTKKDDSGTSVPVLAVRHILLQKKFADPSSTNPDIPPPFLSPREIAEAQLTKSKRQAFVDSIVSAESIQLPEDFAYEISDDLRQSGVRLENRLPQIEAEEQEAVKKLGERKPKR
ncbi:MAG: peptidylprolyl isomerase [Pyrinomonadaceae bacterium]